MKAEFLVLVADDFEGLAETMAELLKGDEVFDTVIALNGAAAMEVVRTRHPHACLLDVNMREMSGVDVARVIRNQLGSHRPLLVGITGGSTTEAAATGFFDLVFEKPLDVDVVAAELKKALRLRADYCGGGA